MLFVVADVIAAGAALPDDPTCTEQPCYWAEPKGASVEPQRLNDIRVKEKSSTYRRTLTDYGQHIEAVMGKPSPQHMIWLRQNLYAATHEQGKIVPAVHAFHPSRFGPVSLTIPGPTDLPNNIEELDVELLPSAAVEVETSPPEPILCLPQIVQSSILVENPILRAELVSGLKFSEEDCQKITESTCGQADNMMWFQQRMGSITASTAHEIFKIYHYDSKASTTRLTDKILASRYLFMKQPPKVTVQSLKYGRDNEERARLQYASEMIKDGHSNVDLQTTGLWVLPDTPYLRASPDGILTCHCHEPRLVEIKCPISAKNSTITEATKKGLLDYLEISDNVISLSKSKRGYYTQIQMAMAVTGLKTCDFVIWSPHEMLMINVPFCPEYWSKLSESLILFFRDHVLPAIISRARTKILIPSQSTDATNAETPESVQNNSNSTRITSVNNREIEEDEASSSSASSNVQAKIKKTKKKSHSDILLQDRQNDPDCYQKKNNKPESVQSNGYSKSVTTVNIRGAEENEASSSGVTSNEHAKLKQTKKKSHSDILLQDRQNDPDCYQKKNNNKIRARTSAKKPPRGSFCGNRRCRKELHSGCNLTEAVPCGCHCQCAKWFCKHCSNVPHQEVFICVLCSKKCN